MQTLEFFHTILTHPFLCQININSAKNMCGKEAYQMQLCVANNIRYDLVDRPTIETSGQPKNECVVNRCCLYSCVQCPTWFRFNDRLMAANSARKYILLSNIIFTHWSAMCCRRSFWNSFAAIFFVGQWYSWLGELCEDDNCHRWRCSRRSLALVNFMLSWWVGQWQQLWRCVLSVVRF